VEAVGVAVVRVPLVGPLDLVQQVKARTVEVMYCSAVVVVAEMLEVVQEGQDLATPLLEAQYIMVEGEAALHFQDLVHLVVLVEVAQVQEDMDLVQLAD
jgi:hypothetical protein